MTDLKWSSYDFLAIPFDRIVRLGQRSLLYQNIFNVSWLLGRYCNYRCSYCWPHARSDKKDHRPLGLLIKTMNEIKRQARSNGFNSFHFSFSGGEPTLHPGYLDLLRHFVGDAANTDYQSCHMTSNLSPGIGWFKKYIGITKTLHRVMVTGSWHREFANKSHFRDKLLLLQGNDVATTVNMVMVPARFEESYEEALFFHKAGINVTLKAQSNPMASRIVSGYTGDQWKRLCNGMPQRDYTKRHMQRLGLVSSRPEPIRRLTGRVEEKGDVSGLPQNMPMELVDDKGRKWYLDQAERFNAFQFNKFKGWRCSAGFQGLVIREPAGDFKRGHGCRDIPLGNIETGFQIFDAPKPCITPSCVISVDTKMPKHKEKRLVRNGRRIGKAGRIE